jgi:hypothetical protein
LILASTFTPIKNALQAFVDKRFKNPLEPLAALKAFQRQVQGVKEVVDPESAARRLLNESASALRASCGAVFLSQSGITQLISVNGDWEAGRESLSLPIGKETNKIGTLYLGPRNDGIAYTDTEISLLAGLTEDLGQILSLV